MGIIALAKSGDQALPTWEQREDLLETVGKRRPSPSLDPQNIWTKYFLFPNSSFYRCRNCFLKMVDDVPKVSQLSSCGGRTRIWVWFLILFTLHIPSPAARWLPAFHHILHPRCFSLHWAVLVYSIQLKHVHSEYLSRGTEVGRLGGSVA